MWVIRHRRCELPTGASKKQLVEARHIGRHFVRRAGEPGRLLGLTASMGIDPPLLRFPSTRIDKKRRLSGVEIRHQALHPKRRSRTAWTARGWRLQAPR